MGKSTKRIEKRHSDVLFSRVYHCREPSRKKGISLPANRQDNQFAIELEIPLVPSYKKKRNDLCITLSVSFLLPIVIMPRGYF